MKLVGEAPMTDWIPYEDRPRNTDVQEGRGGACYVGTTKETLLVSKKKWNSAGVAAEH